VPPEARASASTPTTSRTFSIAGSAAGASRSSTPGAATPTFFCLGQKNDPAGTCREPYVAADDLEAQVEDLYRRIQLPESRAERLREGMAVEIEERQSANTARRALLTGRLAKAENERRKLFNAAVFERLDVKGSRLCHEQYRPPFDGVFTVSEFEYGTRVGTKGFEPSLWAV